MFEKRVEIFKKRDKGTWLEIKETLKNAGIRGVRTGHYLQDSVMAGGCGAKLDPRDFGKKGRIDREIYWIKVRESDEKNVRDILRQNGIVTVVETDATLMTDAALRKNVSDDYYS
ncbi:MAG: hypothetical protein K5770_07790 [Lachnospiraceae bacterium]|nr:hypothetical protein [Lachnospiraceae bacterium]